LSIDLIHLYIWLILILLIIHYSLCKYVNICIFVLSMLICFLHGVHVVSINKTLPINNNTHMSCFPFFHSVFSIVFSLIYYLLISMLFTLLHNALSARCSNQLKTSGSFFYLTTVFCVSQSRLFLILSQFIILSYILLLVIRIVWLYQISSSSFFLLWRWLLLLLLLLLLLFWWLL